MNRFSARSVLSSLIVTSLLAFSGVAHAEGGAGGEAGAAGDAGAAGAVAGGEAGAAGAAAGGAAGAAAGGAAGAAAGGAAGEAAGGSAGAAATTCVGFKVEDAKPLTACDAAEKPATTEFFCKDTSCSKTGKSCKEAYEACIADPLCSAAVYCGSLCAPGENAVNNCGSVAGAAIGKALAVSACADELASQAQGNPASACGTGAAGAGGSGAAGEAAGGSDSGAAGDSAAAGAAGETGSAGSSSTSTPAPAEEDDGCGCSVPGASHSSKAAGLVALGALAFGLRRRRNAK